MKYIQLDQCLHCRTSRASLNSSAAALLSNATPHVISPTFFEHRVFSFLELFQHLLESENLGESTRETALNDKVWELEDSYQRKQNAYLWEHPLRIPQLSGPAVLAGSPVRAQQLHIFSRHIFWYWMERWHSSPATTFTQFPQPTFFYVNWLVRGKGVTSGEAGQVRAAVSECHMWLHLPSQECQVATVPDFCVEKKKIQLCVLKIL